MARKGKCIPLEFQTVRLTMHWNITFSDCNKPARHRNTIFVTVILNNTGGEKSYHLTVDSPYQLLMTQVLLS